MKCFEVVVLGRFSRLVGSLQFAYRKGVGVDDTLLNILHRIYSHVDSAGASARILFLDFSNAFNTILPHISLAEKLIELT